MRTILEEVLTALFFGVAIPGALMSGAVWVQEEQNPEPEPTVMVTEAPETHSLVMLHRGDDGTVEEQDMDTYLVGVVLAEMPAYFETEALKAQAVVARTYTLRAYETGGKHGDGSVCEAYSCCQAYISEAAYVEKGGTWADVEKIRSAVEETSGQVLCYEGELIEATYFSCSGGLTEDAAAVWGTEYPYLCSVESPGEENAAHFEDTVMYSAESFQQALGTELTGSPEQWFGQMTYTVGKGVDTIAIGDRVYRGTELRQKLGLRSTSFSVTVEADTILIHTKGYGHRVGMSQYGADAMAVSGNDYTRILAHYYRGTELTTVEDPKG